MTIEIKHVGGVGNNVSYAVFQDGKHVASIVRNYNQGFRVVAPYEFVLATARNSLAAREVAKTLTYKSVEEYYHDHCALTYRRRREALEEHFALEIARLSRLVLDGSNSARADLAELFLDIETLARDKTKSTIKRFTYESLRDQDIHHLPTYSAPPKQKVAA